MSTIATSLKSVLRAPEYPWDLRGTNRSRRTCITAHKQSHIRTCIPHWDPAPLLESIPFYHSAHFVCFRLVLCLHRERVAGNTIARSGHHGRQFLQRGPYSTPHPVERKEVDKVCRCSLCPTNAFGSINCDSHGSGGFHIAVTGATPSAHGLGRGQLGWPYGTRVILGATMATDATGACRVCRAQRHRGNRQRHALGQLSGRRVSGCR